MSSQHPALESLFRVMGLVDAPAAQTSDPAARTTEAATVKRDTRAKKTTTKRRSRRATVKPAPGAGDEAETDTDH